MRKSGHNTIRIIPDINISPDLMKNLARVLLLGVRRVPTPNNIPISNNRATMMKYLKLN
jgi:hypothetical protein